MQRRSLIRSTIASAIASAAALPSWAQDKWPTKPVTYIVPPADA